MKMLVGGVPFGRNNVGDEAILACVLRLVREACPGAAITVSTDDGPATSQAFGVRTVPLFGFEPPYERAEMERELRENDVFFWAGATGLSDYPEIPTEMMRLAQAAGRRTVVWNVGMNDQLNPAKYRVLPGRRRAALTALRIATLGAFNAVAWEERRRIARAHAGIAAALNAASLVVVRDPESREQLLRCGVTREVIVGADSALILEPAAAPAFPAAAANLLRFAGPKIGICVSAQREIRNTDALVAYLDRVTADGSRRVLFIPMNPITDAKLMAGLQARMRFPDRAAVLEGRFTPDRILAAAAAVDLIISSRLHLLIFASIVHTPFIGVSRGSKVDQFLAPFGLESVGSVEACDFERLNAETERWLAGKTAFQGQSHAVRADLLARLDLARVELKKVLAG